MNDSISMNKSNSGCFKTTLYGVAGAILLIGGCSLLFGGSGGVMPLNEYTMEKYSEAFTRSVVQFPDEQSDLPRPVKSSLYFRSAVESIGYDPDKTIIYLLSPEFESELEQAGLEEGVQMAVWSGGMKLAALGQMDGDCSKSDFERLLTYWSPEAQKAIQKSQIKK